MAWDQRRHDYWDERMERKKHPRATLREIEIEIDKRLSEMRARMMADTVMSSASAEWEKGKAEVCPKCEGNC